MLTAVPRRERNGWMSDDHRINYTRQGDGWIATHRSVENGGNGIDRKHMIAAGMIDQNGAGLVMFPRRADACLAVTDVLSATDVGAPSTRLIMRPLAYEISGFGGCAISGQTSPIKVAQTPQGWQLRGTPGKLDRIMQAQCEDRLSVPARVMTDRWRRMTQIVYPTRQSALHELTLWFESLGIELD